MFSSTVLPWSVAPMTAVSVYVEQAGDLGQVAGHAERRLADRIGGDHDRDLTARLRQPVDEPGYLAGASVRPPGEATLGGEQIRPGHLAPRRRRCAPEG